MSERRTAVVTGANRGIGREVGRQLADLGLDVILTGRDRDRVVAAADELGVRPEVVDVADPASIDAFAARLDSVGIVVDVLVNNAVAYDSATALRITDDELATAIATNLVGPWHLIRAFAPGMAERGYGRIVNVSSGWGSFGEGLGGPATYAVTKAALNALTVVTARDVGDDVLVNAVCPDWVDSAGDGSGGRPVADGASTIVWLATLPAGGASGRFFRDRHEISW